MNSSLKFMKISTVVLVFINALAISVKGQNIGVVTTYKFTQVDFRDNHNNFIISEFYMQNLDTQDIEINSLVFKFSSNVTNPLNSNVFSNLKLVSNGIVISDIFSSIDSIISFNLSSIVLKQSQSVNIQIIADLNKTGLFLKHNAEGNFVLDKVKYNGLKTGNTFEIKPNLYLQKIVYKFNQVIKEIKPLVVPADYCLGKDEYVYGTNFIAGSDITISSIELKILKNAHKIKKISLVMDNVTNPLWVLNPKDTTIKLDAYKHFFFSDSSVNIVIKFELIDTGNINFEIVRLNFFMKNNPNNDSLNFFDINKSCSIKVRDCSKLSIKETNNNFKIYPNPTTDYVLVESQDLLDVYVYNIHGQIVVRGETNQKIDLTNLVNGIYFIKSKDLSINSKLLKN